MTDYREQLRSIKTFPSLVRFLRDDLDWPVATDDFEELTFDYTPEELGIDAENAAKIEEIKRLRPLVANQPWGIFFVKFEPKQLPVVLLRRILNGVVVKKRATSSAAEQPKWETDDLLFVSNYGDGEERRISFAHFSRDPTKNELPTLKVLAWDDLDTPLHLDHAANTLVEKLAWPSSETEWDDETWRERWASAFELRPREVITTSKVLAERLALLARAIRDRINSVVAVETADGPVTKLMEAFREALIHDLDVNDFADMYAQTIAYGLLSARVTNPPAGRHDRTEAHIPVTNPFLKELMESFLDTGNSREPANSGIDFDELGVNEVVELLDDANMEAVVRDFGDRNPEEDPVIHFYELFLKEYDKKQKVSRGVFYTPRPVVSYIVRSVHELLRKEFGLEDGLADNATWAEVTDRLGVEIPEGVAGVDRFITILDPATGTGTFLVEAIDVIHETLVEKWTGQGESDSEIGNRWNDYVSTQLLPRLHGYELLMAPYAIAHLKIGLKLSETGYRFGSDERARIYLTNALEPASDSGQLELEGVLPALAHEARAVNAIKRQQQFTVVLGNPPYSEKSRNEGPWIDGLMERYKATIRSQEAQIKAVSNDYVKFLCLAHHLAETTGVAVLGMITSNGYLDGRLFRDLRHAWLATFSQIYVMNLHGSGRRGDAASADENVFDILQGVAIAVAAILSSGEVAVTRYGEMIASRRDKYLALLRESISAMPTSLAPATPLFLFTPAAPRESNLCTWSLPEVFGTDNAQADRNRTYAGGFKTRQDRFTVAFDEETLVTRISELANDANSETALRAKYRLCSTAHFEFDKARVAAKVGKLAQAIRRARYRPFDDRPMIWAREVLCEPQIEVTRHLLRPNVCLAASRVVKDDAFRHVAVAAGPVEVISLSNSTSTNAYMFPLYRYESGDLAGKAVSDGKRIPNISASFSSALLAAIGHRVIAASSAGKEAPAFTPEDVLAYIVAVLHSPGYRAFYADELLRDFARIPLPNSRELFRDLVALGAELISLHLMEAPVLDRFITAYIGTPQPRVERVGWADETVWLDAPPPGGGRTAAHGTVGFRGVPEAVWSFQVGGYQVCHKWLKDRKGRTLSDDEVAHYQKIVVALSETIRLMSGIDGVIDKHGGWPNAFRTSVAEAAA